MMEHVINNALIMDGSGDTAFIGSFSITGGIIYEVWQTPQAPVSAKHNIDATGLIACPGFIDTHTHSDLFLLHDGRQLSAITQGITSEILGQDGLSYVPLRGKKLKDFAVYMCGVNGLFRDVPLDFHSVDDYLARFINKSGVNVAFLMPHGAIRLAAADFNDRQLNKTEMETAISFLHKGIEQGAVGMSSGLSYFPGAYGDTNELTELCIETAKLGGVYATHLRSVFKGKRFDAVEEALEIARRSGVKLHFSHYRTGVTTLGQSQKVMEKIDDAAAKGIDVSLELYPYPYGASFAAMYLPAWACEGGPDAILERLKDKALCVKIGDFIDSEFGHLDPVVSYAGIDTVYEGKTISQIAVEKGVPFGQAAVELIRSQELMVGCREADPNLCKEKQERFEKDLFELLQRPYYMVGSDAIHIGSHIHPRAFGCFPKLLRLAREHEFPLETLIQRMCDLPARRFGLSGRGLLKKGYAADIVLFDYNAVTDNATPNAPRNPATGIDTVLVNGVIALENGKPTGALAGQVLRKEIMERVVSCQ